MRNKNAVYALPAHSSFHNPKPVRLNPENGEEKKKDEKTTSVRHERRTQRQKAVIRATNTYSYTSTNEGSVVVIGGVMALPNWVWHRLRRRSPFLQAAAFEAVQANFSILAATCHAAIAQPDASHWASVASEAALTLAGARLPDLGHGIIGTGDDTESVAHQAPNALDVTKHAADAFARGNVPQSDRVIEATGKHIARRQRPGRI